MQVYHLDRGKKLHVSGTKKVCSLFSLDVFLIDLDFELWCCSAKGTANILSKLLKLQASYM